MRYQKEIFVEQYPLVDSFTKHLVCYRVIRSNLENLRQGTSFWSDTSTAHLLQASISWCMLFGSDGQNGTHWKKLDLGMAMSKRTFGNAYSRLSPSLRSSGSPTGKRWWIFETTTAPTGRCVSNALCQCLTSLWRSLFFYDSWVRDVIQPDVLDEPPLKQLVDDFQKKVEEEVRCAMTATSALLPRHGDQHSAEDGDAPPHR